MVEPLNPAHTRHHPRWHRRRMPIFWWLRKWRYFRFIARELTSVLVAYAVLLLLAEVLAVARGPDAHAAFRAWLARPPVLIAHAVVLLGLLFHTVTWLNLAPRALVVRLGRRRIPPRAVLVAHYAAWIGVSALLVLLIGRM